MGCAWFGPAVREVAAQECWFHPVSPPLTDLGPADYYRLTGRTGSDPSTWTLVHQPGITGGLYPGGSNVRPPTHEAAGLALAASIQPLDALGTPSPTGSIGFASIGMSNTVQGFGTFMSVAGRDATLNDRLVLVNGALGGGVVEAWTDRGNASRYQAYWDWFDSKVARSKLTHAQVQVVWAEVTSTFMNFAPFPSGIRTFEELVLLLVKELQARLPNLKIVYLSTRARSFNYFAGEPVGFEQGFGVKWLIERQIMRDPLVNYDAGAGVVQAPYLSWGPYLWIDGLTPRSDGRIWPLSYTMDTDCLHPTAAGYLAEADMLMQFFKSDTTTAPWFLDPGTPPPPPPPPPVPDTTPPVISGVSASNVGPAAATISWTTNEPADGQVEFVEPCPSSGCTTPRAASLTTGHSIQVSNLSPEATYRYRVRSTDASANAALSDEYSFDTTAPPPPPSTSALSSWGFSSQAVTDDVNGCTGCANVGATWITDGIVSGAFQLGGTSYLNLGTFPYLTGRSWFSLSLWVQPSFDAGSATWYHAFSDGSNVNVFHVDRARPWRVEVRTTTGTIRVDAPGVTWIPGTWHQIVVTYTPTAATLYWDGVLVGSAAATGGAIMPDSGGTYLGASAIRTRTFSGGLDELRVYDYALTNEEIYANYLNPSN
jgi:hypothetical protein